MHELYHLVVLNYVKTIEIFDARKRMKTAKFEELLFEPCLLCYLHTRSYTS